MGRVTKLDIRPDTSEVPAPANSLIDRNKISITTAAAPRAPAIPSALMAVMAVIVLTVTVVIIYFYLEQRLTYGKSSCQPFLGVINKKKLVPFLKYYPGNLIKLLAGIRYIYPNMQVEVGFA